MNGKKIPRRRVDGVLLLDKPAGLTSNAALQAARRCFRAAKAGHTGTLDPLATGLLPLCFGDATKFAGELLDADKTYRATVQLGVTTDTADAEGNVLVRRPVAVTMTGIQAVCADFIGQIEQIPPMYSALKRDGQPLYRLARQGIEVERAPRSVNIHGIDLVFHGADRFEMTVSCSKGTYIRTLAADIGERLGCGAHLAALRRLRIGGVDIERAVELEALVNASPAELEALLLPPDALLGGLARVDLSETEANRILHGQGIPWNDRIGARFRLYRDGRDFIGLGTISAFGELTPVRLVASG